MAERPLGVTIIAILGIIGAIISVIAGIILLFVGAALVAFLGPLGALGAVAGVIVLVIGIVQLAISYGLLKMKKCALYIELILLIIGIVGSIVMMAYVGDLTQIISIIISAVIFYYLYKKRTLFS